MEFTHLHVHTEYSLLDGSNKIKEYVARVKELGMDSAAITDHGVMYGVIDFYRAARAEGINPILGCEVYVAPGSRFDREAGSGEDRYYHLVLLAENNQGYANLMKIVSKGFTEGFYYKPRVDLAVLKEYHEGIIALSACLAGEVARYLQRGMYEDAKAAALRYQDIFGKGNFFLELQDHGIPAQRLVNQELLRMHEETGIDLVATNDVHYTRAEDADPHDILLCLQTNKKLADEDRMRYEGGQYYVKSPEEMAELFPYALEALENTHKIAQRCHVEIEFGVTKLPRFDVPDGLTSWEYLNKLCFEGLEERYQPVTEELKARLNYELSTIKNMGYVDYFLIVWDFIKYAKDHGIPVGPGRGSAAGSLVAYSLNITDLIDPIKLIFDKSVYRTSWEEIVNNEIFRQRDKSNNNDIGYFHQNIFSYFKGCEVPQAGWDVIYKNPNGIQMPDGDVVHTIYVEMKNKHNTMNSASSAKTYIKMQGQILEDDDCACLLVEAIAKKSQNIKWSTKVDGKNVQHRLIRRVSMDQFYAILTGEEDAFYKMCMALPEVINSVVNEEGGVEVPHDTVIDELRKVASLYGDENGELSMAMAVYMLGFNTYMGFGEKICGELGEDRDGMLKRIYEYVRKMQK